MHNPVMIDARNFLDKHALEGIGFKYVGLGR
jgi:UDPglucose 6-dehydrogenase